MVAHGHHAQAEAAALEDDRLARAALLGTCAHDRDARSAQRVERVEEGDRPVVERVVVGEGDRVDPKLREPLGRDRRGAEEERLAGIGKPLPTIRDAALQVEHEEVGRGRGLPHTCVEERSGRVAHQPVANAAAEHRVARERERDRRRPLHQRLARQCPASRCLLAA